MLEVRVGDRGPRVVLLQALLNRRGAGLVIDGVFGSRTGRAVNDARVRLMAGPGQVADPDLWVGLFEEQRLCAIDAFDMGEERFQTGAAIVRSAGSRVVATGAMCDGVPSVVQGILGQTTSPGSLGLLRTWGHGNRGHWLSFTVGDIVHTTERDPVLGAAIARERGSYVDPASFDGMSHLLSPIRRCFADIAIYEHHGCSLGKLDATRRMMGKLAHLWDVPVTVAVGTQLIPFVGETALRYQGKTYTAYPRGGESAWIARVRATQRMSR